MYDKRSRMEKAFRLVEAGKVSITSKGMGLVNGSKNVTYEVNLNDFTCRIAGGVECDDMKYNCDIALCQVCKHILAVQLVFKHKEIPVI